MKLLKRWAAVPIGLWFLVVYCLFIVSIVLGSLWWFVTGHSLGPQAEKAMKYLFDDYWNWYGRWAEK